MKNELLKKMDLSDLEFNKLRSLVFDNFGINLTESKRTLIIGRLQGTLKAHGFTSFDEYYSAVVEDDSGNLISELINRVSTNFTYFYREEEHFKYMRDVVLPQIEVNMDRSKSEDIRFWCAGCASGEEPYSIIMELMEYFNSRYSHLDAGILATDISTKAIGAAQAARYPHESISRLPKNYISKYMVKKGEDDYHVCEKVQNEVMFRKLNLMHDFPFKGKFDVIFCRNVMIYFDQPTKDTLVNKYADVLKPGGYLFIGHSETISRNNSKLQYIQPAVYRKI